MIKILFVIIFVFMHTVKAERISNLYNYHWPIFKINLEEPIDFSVDDIKQMLAIYKYDYIDNIYQMHLEQLFTGKSKIKTWSYHSFPTHKGGIANRYLITDFRTNNDWSTLFKLYQNSPSEKLIEKSKINLLSPMEKYEYLIGNINFKLTKLQWKEGEDALRIYGEVPRWFGACHGTAPSTIRGERPSKAISLKSYDGKHDIIFYPSDIKALLSYAWAVNGGQAAVLGTRCNIRRSNADRYSAPPSCIDVNPGSFHLAMINLLGRNGEPFILDTSAGLEIWNKSIVNYKIKYYRPTSRMLTTNLDNAIINRNIFTTDKYKKYRSANSTHIVGIWAELTMVNRIVATDAKTNTAEDDSYDKLTLWYDLELDTHGNIIGGEWSDPIHPDFLWVVAPNAKPLTVHDYSLKESNIQFNSQLPLPERIRTLAISLSNTNQVLYWILEKMLLISSTKQ